MLKHYFSDVDKLSEELSKQLWLILCRTLTSVRKEPKIIVSALRIIEREEMEDAAAISLHKRTGYMKVGRPKQWRHKAFEVLKKSVLERYQIVIPVFHKKDFCMHDCRIFKFLLTFQNRRKPV